MNKFFLLCSLLLNLKVVNFFPFFQSVRNECVQVVVRCRPFTNKEETSNFQRVVDVFPSRGVIEVINPEDSSKENRKMFTYDAVYDWK